MHDIVHAYRALAARPTGLISSAFFYITIIMSKCTILIILSVNPYIFCKLIYQLLSLLLGHILSDSAARHRLAGQTVGPIAREARPADFRRNRNQINRWNLIYRLKLASAFSLCPFEAVGYHRALFQTPTRLLFEQTGLCPGGHRNVLLDLHLVAH